MLDCWNKSKIDDFMILNFPVQTPYLWKYLLFSTQIAWIDHYYLWKKSIDILGFLNGHTHFRKVTTETITFGGGVARCA